MEILKIIAFLKKIAHPSPIFSFFYKLPVKLNWILIQQNRISDDSSFDAEGIDTQINQGTKFWTLRKPHVQFIWGDHFLI